MQALQVTSESTEQKDEALSKKKKINWWKVLEYSLPALIALGIFFFAMVIKGIYPFGGKHIGYIDYDDGLVPSYTYLWDVLHGNANLFVDWNLGGGGSFVTSAVINSFLSPISWLIAIFPREGVMFGVAFLVVIKLMLMATTAYICFKKYFPRVSKWLLLLYSLTWTFSGWTLVHFTNIGWLDIMILLPLLLISAKKLVAEGKILWTVIILSYMLMLSYYISYMVLVGVVVIATVYVCTLAENKKRTASSLFWAILVSILISAVAFIPSCLTSLQAHRFDGDASGTSGLFENFFTKLSLFVMFALPFVFFMKLLFTYKKDKKVVLFFMLSFIICSLGLIIEPINEMWHTGSYYSFPFRYSFVILLLMIFGSLYYIDKYISAPEQSEVKPQKSKKVSWFWALLPPIFGMAIIVTVILAIFATNLIPYRPMSFGNAVLYIVTFGLTYGAIELLLLIKSKKLKLGNLPGGALIFALCLVQIFSLTVGFVGNSYHNTTQRVTNAFNIETPQLESGYKIKDREAVYNHNFGMLISYPTLSTWIHISSEEQFQAYDALGYNSSSTILLSSGGTMMTDALLGNRYVLSQEQLNPTYYRQIDSFEYVEDDSDEKSEVLLYETVFESFSAIATNVDFAGLFDGQESYFDAQNKLFRALYQTENDVVTNLGDITIEEFESTEQQVSEGEFEKGFTITLQVPTDKNIYLASQNLQLDAKIDGKERTLYSGINDLGFDEDGSVTLVVENPDGKWTAEDIQERITFGAFDAELFATEHSELSEQNQAIVNFDGSSLQISYNNAENYQYLFVPYVNLKNMSGMLNGESAEVASAFGGFMMVSLQQGENSITLSYQPQYLSICLIVTLVSLAIFVIFSLLNWKFDLASKKWVVWPGFVGACLVLAVVGVLVYLKPFFYDFFARMF